MGTSVESKGGLPRRRERMGIALSGVAWALLMALAAAPAAAQEAGRPMFDRFGSARDIVFTWQRMVELPASIRPQTAPGAHIVANEGINYVVAFRPESRVYFSRSFGYARMQWQPEDAVRSIHVIQFDVTEILNFLIARTFVLSFGVGLGVMDGLIVERTGDYQTRLEPFLPVQVGAAALLGRRFILGVKIVQSSFFGPGPVASVTRGMIGFGYNY